MRRNKTCIYFLNLTILAFVLVMSGCSKGAAKGPGNNNNDNTLSQNPGQSTELDSGSSVITKEYLDSYKPQKTDYNFYFTYKIVHSWWDAVALGMEDAVRQFEEKGIHITYDYRAPEEMSALDQVQTICCVSRFCTNVDLAS